MDGISNNRCRPHLPLGNCRQLQSVVRLRQKSRRTGLRNRGVAWCNDRRHGLKVDGTSDKLHAIALRTHRSISVGSQEPYYSHAPAFVTAYSSIMQHRAGQQYINVTIGSTWHAVPLTQAGASTQRQDVHHSSFVDFASCAGVR